VQVRSTSPLDIKDLKQALAHVLWIGGPPDSGKTSVATLLATKYGLQTYHFDRHEPEHFARLDPRRHPALYGAHPVRMTTEERWLGSPPDEMACATIACWSERFEMALEDLLAMPSAPRVVAEGPGFFPDRLGPLLCDPGQALWLLPSEAFKRASALARGKPGTRHETSDPERATENLIRRDLLMGAHIQQRATELGLTVLLVDGSQSLEAVAARVEAHFGPRLAPIAGG
jgi:hypothetical protein